MNSSQYFDDEFLKKYDLKVKEHWFCLYPGFLKAVGKVKGKRVLDIGCGSGDLTAEYAKLGAESVVGIDDSKKWINLCKQRFAKTKILSFMLADASSLKKFKNESFDIVACNMVLLNIFSKKKMEKAVFEASRVLKNNGFFVFSDLHPLVIMTKKLPTRISKISEKFSYFRNGDYYSNIVKIGGKEKIEFSNLHWTFEFYAEILEKEGFCIQRIFEPKYLTTAPAYLKAYKVPEYIIFKCKKA